jgi:hypothetical protein
VQNGADESVFTGEMSVDAHLRGLAFAGDAIDAGGETLGEEEWACTLQDMVFVCDFMMWDGVGWAMARWNAGGINELPF